VEQDRLAEQKIEAELTDNAADYLARAGYDPTYGARPLRRLMYREVVNKISKEILKGAFKHGDKLVVDSGPEGIEIRKSN